MPGIKSIGDYLSNPTVSDFSNFGQFFSAEADVTKTKNKVSALTNKSKSTNVTNKKPSSVGYNDYFNTEDVPTTPTQSSGNALNLSSSQIELGKAGVMPNTVQNAPQQDSTQQLIRELIQSVTDPNSGVISVKLPNGLEVTGTSPNNTQATGNNRNSNTQAESESTANVNTTPPVGQASAQNQPAGESSFKNRLYNALSSPQFGYVLGRAAQAVTANVPNSAQYQLGGLAAEISQGEAYSKYLEDLRSGNTPGGYANILTPEQRAIAENRVLAERKLALDELNAGVEREYTKAQTKGILTAEEKKQMEAERNLTQKEINFAKIAADLSLGTMKNKWMSLGKDNNYAFNLDTKEVIQVEPTQGSSGASVIGNLSSPMYSKFEEAAVAEFLPQIFKKHQKEWAERGWTTLVQLREAMRDEKTGTVDWGRLMPVLSPEERAKFSQRLAEYTYAHLQGIPYTVKFADIMTKKVTNQKLVKPDFVAQEDWDAATPEQRRQLLESLGMLE